METNKKKWVLGGCSGRMITVNDFYGGDGFIADVDTLGNAERIIECVNNYDALKEENERLKEVLKKIANWELPNSGQYWDQRKPRNESNEMSYEAAFGSNGVRDYIKWTAEKALLQSTAKEDGNNEKQAL